MHIRIFFSHYEKNRKETNAEDQDTTLTESTSIIIFFVFRWQQLIIVTTCYYHNYSSFLQLQKLYFPPVARLLKVRKVHWKF